ncbi:hypothetical protein BDR07DRAFT_949238 [Suillus spraguei]|nr:hypothetical protein BDR07DRAFT_949238 [Suillus spraguei]
MLIIFILLSIHSPNISMQDVSLIPAGINKVSSKHEARQFMHPAACVRLSCMLTVQLNASPLKVVPHTNGILRTRRTIGPSRQDKNYICRSLALLVVCTMNAPSA